MIKSANLAASHYFTSRKWSHVSVVAIVVLASVSMAMAQAGELDKTFGNGGVFLAQNAGLSNTVASAVAIQSDGKILVAGQALSQANGPQPAVLRITSTGTLDTAFGNGGVAIVNFAEGGNEFATGMIVQSDGKIVIGVSFGNADGAPRLELARLNTDGTLDTTFGTAGTVGVFRSGPDTAYVALQPDGKILLGGGLLMARVNPDGTLDTSFGQNGIATLIAPASSIALQSNGQILAMTNGNGGQGVPPSNGGLVRYNANGTVDSSFGIRGRLASVVGTSAVLLQTKGQIVVVGPVLSKSFVATFPAVTFNTEFGVARYHSNGSSDSRFGKNGLVLSGFSNTIPFAIPSSLVFQTNREIIAAGQAAQSPASSFALTRYTVTGGLDTTFGSGGKVVTAFGTNNAGIVAVALDSEGRLVAVGTVANTAGLNQQSIAVARYLTQ